MYLYIILQESFVMHIDIAAITGTQSIKIGLD